MLKSALARLLFVLSLTAIGALIAGCGDDSSPTGGGGGTTRPHFKTVSINGSSFSPSSLTIAVGDTVRWTNFDNVTHSVTSDAGTELDSPIHGERRDLPAYLHVGRLIPLSLQVPCRHGRDGNSKLVDLLSLESTFKSN